MRTISERDLAVVLPLLAAKIRDLTMELRASQALGGDPTEEQIDDQVQIQEMIEQYDGIFDSLRDEYEAGLKEGIQLPAFDELVHPFRLGPTNP